MRGCIVKRGKNSWAVVVYLGRDPQTGKGRQKWFSHPSRREAEQHLAQVLNQLHAGGTVPNTKKRLGDWLQEWLRGHAAHLQPTTEKSYRETIEKHLVPELGHVPIGRLSPQAIRDYQAKKLAAGLSPTSVRYHRMLLREVLQQAVRDGLMVRNPADLVKPPAKQRYEVPTLDEEWVRLFLGEAKRSSRYYRLYLAAITTGMREGELLGLRWQDVDLTLGVASVRQTFYRLGQQKLFKTPKTAKSRRTVDLPPVLVEELRQLRQERDARRRLLGRECAADLDLVFCLDDGRPLHVGNLTRRDFRKVLERAGLPQVRFHDLRHGHATLLLQQGVHPKVVQERLGHSTISVTMDTYSHVVPGLQRQAILGLESRLFHPAAGTKT
jgi:integrase